MSAVSTPPRSFAEPVQLHSGDRMNRQQFHRLYKQTARKFKAELIGGIVYVASPLRRSHGNEHLHLGMLFSAYELNTPGVEAGDNATVILGDESEPQPDLYLRVLRECGGQSSTDEDDYVIGAPELVAEISHSSVAIDLHDKRDDYAHNGVREYLVATLADRKLHWFELPSMTELAPDADGILRVRYFPGFWIHVEALFAHDFQRLMDTLQQGLSTPEHAAFVKRLREARGNL